MLILIAHFLHYNYLKNKVMECKANTKVLKEQYDSKLDNYDQNIKDIVKFYEGELTDVDTFERRVDETDCDAAKRFFDGVSY